MGMLRRRIAAHRQAAFVSLSDGAVRPPGNALPTAVLTRFPFSQPSSVACAAHMMNVHTCVHPTAYAPTSLCPTACPLKTQRRSFVPASAPQRSSGNRATPHPAVSRAPSPSYVNFNQTKTRDRSSAAATTAGREADAERARLLLAAMSGAPPIDGEAQTSPSEGAYHHAAPPAVSIASFMTPAEIDALADTVIAPFFASLRAYVPVTIAAAGVSRQPPPSPIPQPGLKSNELTATVATHCSSQHCIGVVSAAHCAAVAHVPFPQQTAEALKASLLDLFAAELHAFLSSLSAERAAGWDASADAERVKGVLSSATSGPPSTATPSRSPSSSSSSGGALGANALAAVRVADASGASRRTRNPSSSHSSHSSSTFSHNNSGSDVHHLGAVQAFGSVAMELLSCPVWASRDVLRSLRIPIRGSVEGDDEGGENIADVDGAAGSSVVADTAKSVAPKEPPHPPPFIFDVTRAARQHRLNHETDVRPLVGGGWDCPPSVASHLPAYLTEVRHPTAATAGQLSQQQPSLAAAATSPSPSSISTPDPVLSSTVGGGKAVRRVVTGANNGFLSQLSSAASSPKSGHRGEQGGPKATSPPLPSPQENTATATAPMPSSAGFDGAAAMAHAHHWPPPAPILPSACEFVNALQTAAPAAVADPLFTYKAHAPIIVGGSGAGGVPVSDATLHASGLRRSMLFALYAVRRDVRASVAARYAALLELSPSHRSARAPMSAIAAAAAASSVSSTHGAHPASDAKQKKKARDKMRDRRNLRPDEEGEGKTAGEGDDGNVDEEDEEGRIAPFGGAEAKAYHSAYWRTVRSAENNRRATIAASAAQRRSLECVWWSAVGRAIDAFAATTNHAAPLRSGGPNNSSNDKKSGSSAHDVPAAGKPLPSPSPLMARLHASLTARCAADVATFDLSNPFNVGSGLRGALLTAATDAPPLVASQLTAPTTAASLTNALAASLLPSSPASPSSLLSPTASVSVATATPSHVAAERLAAAVFALAAVSAHSALAAGRRGREAGRRATNREAEADAATFRTTNGSRPSQNFATHPASELGEAVSFSSGGSKKVDIGGGGGGTHDDELPDDTADPRGHVEAFLCAAAERMGAADRRLWAAIEGLLAEEAASRGWVGGDGPLSPSALFRFAFGDATEPLAPTAAAGLGQFPNSPASELAAAVSVVQPAIASPGRLLGRVVVASLSDVASVCGSAPSCSTPYLPPPAAFTPLSSGLSPFAAAAASDSHFSRRRSRTASPLQPQHTSPSPSLTSFQQSNHVLYVSPLYVERKGLCLKSSQPSSSPSSTVTSSSPLSSSSAAAVVVGAKPAGLSAARLLTASVRGAILPSTDVRVAVTDLTATEAERYIGESPIVEAKMTAPLSRTCDRIREAIQAAGDLGGNDVDVAMQMPESSDTRAAPASAHTTFLPPSAGLLGAHSLWQFSQAPSTSVKIEAEGEGGGGSSSNNSGNSGNNYCRSFPSPLSLVGEGWCEDLSLSDAVPVGALEVAPFTSAANNGASSSLHGCPRASASSRLAAEEFLRMAEGRAFVGSTVAEGTTEGSTAEVGFVVNSQRYNGVVTLPVREEAGRPAVVPFHAHTEGKEEKVLQQPSLPSSKGAPHTGGSSGKKGALPASPNFVVGLDDLPQKYANVSPTDAASPEGFLASLSLLLQRQAMCPTSASQLEFELWEGDGARSNGGGNGKATASSLRGIGEGGTAPPPTPPAVAVNATPYLPAQCLRLQGALGASHLALGHNAPHRLDGTYFYGGIRLAMVRRQAALGGGEGGGASSSAAANGAGSSLYRTILTQRDSSSGTRNGAQQLLPTRSEAALTGASLLDQLTRPLPTSAAAAGEAGARILPPPAPLPAHHGYAQLWLTTEEAFRSYGAVLRSPYEEAIFAPAHIGTNSGNGVAASLGTSFAAPLFHASQFVVPSTPPSPSLSSSNASNAPFGAAATTKAAVTAGSPPSPVFSQTETFVVDSLSRSLLGTDRSLTLASGTDTGNSDGNRPTTAATTDSGRSAFFVVDVDPFPPIPSALTPNGLPSLRDIVEREYLLQAAHLAATALASAAADGATPAAVAAKALHAANMPTNTPLLSASSSSSSPAVSTSKISINDSSSSTSPFPPFHHGHRHRNDDVVATDIGGEIWSRFSAPLRKDIAAVERAQATVASRAAAVTALALLPERRRGGEGGTTQSSSSVHLLSPAAFTSTLSLNSPIQNEAFPPAAADYWDSFSPQLNLGRTPSARVEEDLRSLSRQRRYRSPHFFSISFLLGCGAIRSGAYGDAGAFARLRAGERPAAVGALGAGSLERRGAAAVARSLLSASANALMATAPLTGNSTATADRVGGKGKSKTASLNSTADEEDGKASFGLYVSPAVDASRHRSDHARLLSWLAGYRIAARRWRSSLYCRRPPPPTASARTTGGGGGGVGATDSPAAAGAECVSRRYADPLVSNMLRSLLSPRPSREDAAGGASLLAPPPTHAGGPPKKNVSSDAPPSAPRPRLPSVAPWLRPRSGAPPLGLAYQVYAADGGVGSAGAHYCAYFMLRGASEGNGLVLSAPRSVRQHWAAQGPVGSVKGQASARLAPASFLAALADNEAASSGPAAAGAANPFLLGESSAGALGSGRRGDASRFCVAVTKPSAASLHVNTQPSAVLSLTGASRGPSASILNGHAVVSLDQIDLAPIVELLFPTHLCTPQGTPSASLTVPTTTASQPSRAQQETRFLQLLAMAVVLVWPHTVVPSLGVRAVLFTHFFTSNDSSPNTIPSSDSRAGARSGDKGCFLAGGTCGPDGLPSGAAEALASLATDALANPQQSPTHPPETGACMMPRGADLSYLFAEDDHAVAAFTSFSDFCGRGPNAHSPPSSSAESSPEGSEFGGSESHRRNGFANARRSPIIDQLEALLTTDVRLRPFRTPAAEARFAEAALRRGMLFVPATYLALSGIEVLSGHVGRSAEVPTSLLFPLLLSGEAGRASSTCAVDSETTADPSSSSSPATPTAAAVSAADFATIPSTVSALLDAVGAARSSSSVAFYAARQCAEPLLVARWAAYAPLLPAGIRYSRPTALRSVFMSENNFVGRKGCSAPPTATRMLRSPSGIPMAPEAGFAGAEKQRDHATAKLWLSLSHVSQSHARAVLGAMAVRRGYLSPAADLPNPPNGPNGDNYGGAMCSLDEAKERDRLRRLPLWLTLRAINMLSDVLFAVEAAGGVWSYFAESATAARSAAARVYLAAAVDGGAPPAEASAPFDFDVADVAEGRVVPSLYRGQLVTDTCFHPLFALRDLTAAEEAATAATTSDAQQREEGSTKAARTAAAWAGTSVPSPHHPLCVNVKAVPSALPDADFGAVRALLRRNRGHLGGDANAESDDVDNATDDEGNDNSSATAPLSYAEQRDFCYFHISDFADPTAVIEMLLRYKRH